MEHQLIAQGSFSICRLENPSSTSESTPVLCPTTRACPKFTDKPPDDIILAVKHSRAHFQESLLREQDNYMRNTHYRTTTFPYKDNIDYFSKSPIWNIWQRIQKRDFQEWCLKATLENCLDCSLRISEQVVTVPPDQLELNRGSSPSLPCWKSLYKRRINIRVKIHMERQKLSSAGQALSSLLPARDA